MELSDAMVLGLLHGDSPPRPATLSRVHAEVCQAELAMDGMVHRSGRWLQRRGYAFWSLGPCLSWRQLLIRHLKNDEIRRSY